jgi:hypothetical protein
MNDKKVSYSKALQPPLCKNYETLVFIFYTITFTLVKSIESNESYKSGGGQRFLTFAVNPNQ